jgi:hypothetical protein
MTVLNCATSKDQPKFIIGEKEFNRVLVTKGDLNIVTPNVELYNSSLKYNKSDYSRREELQNRILKKLKSELGLSEVFELELMNKDYKTINNVLEYLKYKKQSNPNLVITAPDEILISNLKYSLLVSISGYYGRSEKSILFLILINNEDKLIESVDRYEYEFSPLNNKLIEDAIEKALKSIIKT